jgi:hypothetical protein
VAQNCLFFKPKPPVLSTFCLFNDVYISS